MMITKNSAKCTACGTEIVSTHVHHFAVHTCAVEPTQARKWVGDKLVDDEGKTTWRFAVDGGNDYLRRCGEGYIDTSEYTE